MQKVVLVTGGAGGIGSAISKKFAEEGYSVIITYHSNQSKAEMLLNQLVKVENQIHLAVKCSVTNADEIKELANIIKGNYEHLDVLINNAGKTIPVPHEDLDGLSDEWIDDIMKTNFRGSFAMIRAMKDLLLIKAEATSPSLIVNLSSIAAVTGIGSNVAYCASKAALNSMTRSLGRALAPLIRVVSVSPGWVLGEYTKEIDPIYLQAQLAKTPMARLANNLDVAKVVFGLTDIITFCTGNIIEVDGGRGL